MITKLKVIFILTVFYFVLLQTVSAQSPDNGLTGRWAFDEGSGMTAADSSGNNNAGTLINGPVWVTGISGNALSFDGLDDYMEINDNNTLDLTGGEFTLSAWVYPESFGESSNGRIIDHGGGSTGEGGWSFLMYDSAVPGEASKGYAVYSRTDATIISFSNDNAAVLYGWQHVAATFSAGTVTIYVNGQDKGQTSGVHIPSDRNAPIRIGMRATDSLRTFTGVIDEVRMYDRALTPQEIMDLYNQAPSLSDISPPAISDGQPTGVLPSGTTSVTMFVTTDETATCKYSIFPGTPYSSMTNTFLTPDGTTHGSQITDLKDDYSRMYYIKCRDQTGNINPDDYSILFSVHRDVYHVSSSGSDSGPGTNTLPLKTIQRAIFAVRGAPSYDALIKVAQGTYYENIGIKCCVLQNNVSIQGGWSPDFTVRDEGPHGTVIDGGGKGHVFFINTDTLNLTIEGFTIRNGFDSVSGGGIYVFPFHKGDITLNLYNNIIAGNSAGAYGGGVSIVSKGGAAATLSFFNNVIINNHGNDYCGGVCVHAEDSATSATVNFTDNTVIDNSAGYHAGGIHIRAYSGAAITSTFTNNAITDNSASYFGAGVYVYAESGATLSANFHHNRITGNSNPYFGGGVYLHSVSSSSLITNFSDNIINGNSASIHGGGIYMLSAMEAAMMSSFSHNTITANSAGYDGGGVFTLGNVTSTFANNVLAGNTANRGAGAFGTNGIAFVLTNNTITNNNASFQGGGIYAHNIYAHDSGSVPPTVLEITNTIVFGNTVLTNADIYIKCAFWDSQDVLNPCPVPDFTTVNLSYSDVENVLYDPDYPVRYNDFGGNRSLDPLFIDAANMDYHLSSSSPLINQGNSSAAYDINEDFERDQRIAGSEVDIGADELLISTPVPYYCDYDNDGFIESSSNKYCFIAGCEPVYCQTAPGTDCNDKDFYEHPGQTWYKDEDNDGHSDGTTDRTSCTRPQGHKTDLELRLISGDCDDADEFINPLASEIWYDGVDQDCNEWNDYDQDRDMFVHETWNEQAGGSSPGIDDCDDSNFSINPQTRWYPDLDGDSYGNPAINLVQCNPLPDYVMDDQDCNDNDAGIYPGGASVRIYGEAPSYFHFLQEAYNTANDGDTIQSQDGFFTENLFFDLNKTVYIQGGYDCSYSFITGVSTIYGALSITDGVVTVEDMDLQVPLDDFEY